MNLNLAKKQIDASLIIELLNAQEYQTIQSNLILKKEKNTFFNAKKDINLPELLKIKKENKFTFKNKTIKIPNTIFNFNSSKNNKNFPINELQKSNKALSNNKVIGSIHLKTFEKNSIIANSVNMNVKKQTSLWFVQMKSFFLKMPKNNNNLWVLKNTEIYNLININYTINNTLFVLNKKNNI